MRQVCSIAWLTTQAGALAVLESCCSPIVGQVLDQADAERLATALKADRGPSPAPADLDRRRLRRRRGMRLRSHRPGRALPADRLPPPQDPGRRWHPEPRTTWQVGLLPTRPRRARNTGTTARQPRRRGRMSLRRRLPTRSASNLECGASDAPLVPLAGATKDERRRDPAEHVSGQPSDVSERLSVAAAGRHRCAVALPPQRHGQGVRRGPCWGGGLGQSGSRRPG